MWGKKVKYEKTHFHASSLVQCMMALRCSSSQQGKTTRPHYEAQGPSGDEVGPGQKPHAHTIGLQIRVVATVQRG
jgi:hypothetical protein